MRSSTGSAGFPSRGFPNSSSSDAHTRCTMRRRCDTDARHILARGPLYIRPLCHCFTGSILCAIARSIAICLGGTSKCRNQFLDRRGFFDSSSRPFFLGICFAQTTLVRPSVPPHERRRRGSVFVGWSCRSGVVLVSVPFLNKVGPYAFGVGTRKFLKDARQFRTSGSGHIH